MSNLKNWKAALLLSLIIPVGFLTTFKLTGLLSGPTAIAETKTLEPVKWEYEKSLVCTNWPLWFYGPDETYVNNFYSKGSASVTFALVPTQYIVSYAFFDGSSVLGVSLNMTAGIADGFIDNVRILFREDYDTSQVCLFGWQTSFWSFENLSIRDIAYCFHGESKLEGDEKASVEASGTNRPRGVQIRGCIYWVLRAPENMSQQLEATAEVTYFNGTSYTEVLLPILLNLIGDAGNTLETARTITPGNYTANIAGENLDPVDCYKIWLKKGQTISIRALLRYPQQAR